MRHVRHGDDVTVPDRGDARAGRIPSLVAFVVGKSIGRMEPTAPVRLARIAQESRLCRIGRLRARRAAARGCGSASRAGRRLELIARISRHDRA
jgi:hypothetical protein